MKSRSKYRVIADNLRDRIICGELSTGEKFYTRKQLCAMFNISLMTAFNVQKILQDDGLIICEPGVGFFVNRPEMYRLSHPNAPVRKIRMIGSPQAIGEKAVFGSELVAGVREKCEEYGLELTVEFVQVLDNPAHVINTSRCLAEDEALVVFMHDELLPEVVNLLLSPDVRAVTVSRTFPDKPAILHDIRHAAKTILDFCRKLKAAKVLYAGQCSHWKILRHESEFFAAFKELAENYDFEYETDFSGKFPVIVEHIKTSQPDVVVFSQDEPAVRLLSHFYSNGEMRPPFVGFGDFHSVEGEAKLRYTYRSDAREMGRMAVETVLKLDDGFHPPLDVRVPGIFIERN